MDQPVPTTGSELATVTPLMPAIKVALCTAGSPMRMAFDSAATPTFPMSRLLLPVVRFKPALIPNAMLLPPVLLTSASIPLATLPLPVVLLMSAPAPMAVLLMPVVLLKSA